MNFLQRTRILHLLARNLRLQQNASRKFTELTFRLAESSDFDEVVKLSEGVYSGYDYLPLVYHQWLEMDNLAVMLAHAEDKLVGLQACSVVDDGTTLVRRGARTLPELRRVGVQRKLANALDDYVREHFPKVCRRRLTAWQYGDPVNKNWPWGRRIFEHDVLSYYVEDSKASLPNGGSELEIATCTRDCFSKTILSAPVTEKLFSENVILFDFSCPYNPVGSNVNYIFREYDSVPYDLHLFVEKCSAGHGAAWPMSFSHGIFAQRVIFSEWIATVYTDDPALFEAHLLHHLKRAREVIKGRFTFFTFQDKSMTACARRVLGEVMQLKEANVNNNETIKLYEREFK